MARTYKFTTIPDEGVNIQVLEGATVLSDRDITGGGGAKFEKEIRAGEVVGLSIYVPTQNFSNTYYFEGNTFIVDDVTIEGTGDTLANNLRTVLRPVFPNAGDDSGNNVYQHQTVATYADAVAAATGTQYKIIKVTTDETDGGNTNRYYYEGVEGELDLQF